MKIEVKKNVAYIDGKKWGKKPKGMDLGDFLLNMLYYTNKNGKKRYTLIVNGKSVTAEFRAEVKKKYLNIPNKKYRKDIFNRANVR